MRTYASWILTLPLFHPDKVAQVLDGRGPQGLAQNVGQSWVIAVLF